MFEQEYSRQIHKYSSKAERAVLSQKCGDMVHVNSLVATRLLFQFRAHPPPEGRRHVDTRNGKQEKRDAVARRIPTTPYWMSTRKDTNQIQLGGDSRAPPPGRVYTSSRKVAIWQDRDNVYCNAKSCHHAGCDASLHRLPISGIAPVVLWRLAPFSLTVALRQRFMT